MGADYPYLYPWPAEEARRRKEERRHEDSFRENVRCARAIEKAIRIHFDEEDEALKEDCARSVLEQFGYQRTFFVLSNSLKELGSASWIDEDVRQWIQKVYVPDDGKYNRYFAVDTAAALLESFIRQTHDEYQALGLFGPEHCVDSHHDQDFKGKVLIMSTDTLKESCWCAENQLWYAYGGFGCAPNARGQAVYAVCLEDGEDVRWNRTDFLGVLDEQYLPDWAQEKLPELRGPRQEQTGGPAMGGMTMESL